MRITRFISVLGLMIAGLLAAAALAGCSSGGVTNVDAQGVKDALDRGVVVVDIREPQEFEAGHIPGAINIPMGTVSSAMASWPKDTEFVIYCNTANRSGQLLPTLRDMGFTNVLHYSTGIQTWDGEIERGGGTVKAPEFTQVGFTGPAMYEFYTDWCPSCVDMKPIVDTLQPHYEGVVEFKLYNVEKSSEGSQLAASLGLEYVPSFVLVDSSNKIVETWAGSVSEDVLKSKLDALR